MGELITSADQDFPEQMSCDSPPAVKEKLREGKSEEALSMRNCHFPFFRLRFSFSFSFLFSRHSLISFF